MCNESGKINVASTVLLAGRLIVAFSYGNRKGVIVGRVKRYRSGAGKKGGYYQCEQMR